MKSRFINILAIILFGLLVTGFSNEEIANTRIFILAPASQVSPGLLSETATIITARLNDFGPDKFNVSILPGKNQIQVSITGNQDVELLENLLTHKGIIGFYETYNQKSLSELLKGDDRLFSLFGGLNSGNTGARIGCKELSEIGKVNDYLSSLGLEHECKFAWSQFFDKPETCLYALRDEAGKGAILTGADVESMKFKKDRKSKNNTIDIRFKKSAIETWSGLTRRNLNEAIAIVLDEQVIFAPVVQSVIEGGHSSISGAFTRDQARYIAALGNNGELPVSIQVVK